MSFYLNEYITLHFTVDVNIILKSCYNDLYGNVNIKALRFIYQPYTCIFHHIRYEKR